MQHHFQTYSNQTDSYYLCLFHKQTHRFFTKTICPVGKLKCKLISRNILIRHSQLSMADSFRIPTDDEEQRMKAAAEASRQRREEARRKEEEERRRQEADMVRKAGENSRKRREDNKGKDNMI